MSRDNECDYRDFRDFSESLSASPFEIDLSIFEDSYSSDDEEKRPPTKKTKLSPGKKRCWDINAWIFDT